ncbi:hypothetical protein AM500_03205 [Bacillus sp. FJAT-18017]|uniref:hypothetical protein n=1 Tax=Bacillus sp. FJAT-18017 TaxID=1705566 RepID=UPI0006ADF9F4|nr:hypothetical protein [Bacillus sp. FJAT-18017]ALC88917.1 hypothetical protein AM500_03205 [Bacillus sp. FJAT-18017]
MFIRKLLTAFIVSSITVLLVFILAGIYYLTSMNDPDFGNEGMLLWIVYSILPFIVIFFYGIPCSLLIEWVTKISKTNRIQPLSLYILEGILFLPILYFVTPNYADFSLSRYVMSNIFLVFLFVFVSVLFWYVDGKLIKKLKVIKLDTKI